MIPDHLGRFLAQLPTSRGPVPCPWACLVRSECVVASDDATGAEPGGAVCSAPPRLATSFVSTFGS